jgi:hypothetical protein
MKFGSYTLDSPSFDRPSGIVPTLVQVLRAAPSVPPRRRTLLVRNGKGVALGLLGRTCGRYAILAGTRNWPGVTTTNRVK